MSVENKTKLIDSTLSFTIQSLLDQMAGQNCETDEFTSEVFVASYSKTMLDGVNMKSNKKCVQIRDFNVDLIKYSSETKTGYIYDVLCSNSFRPLIPQPSRVKSRSVTLTDNIFINVIVTHKGVT